MNKFLCFYCLLFLVVFINSCTLEEQLERREDRILGAWIIEKAWYKSDRALFRRNVEDEYGEDIIEFFADYSAVYDDLQSGELFWGDWNLSGYREDGEGVEFLLDMEFYNARDQRVFSFLSNVTLLTRGKLNITVHEPTGVLTFKLRRLD